MKTIQLKICALAIVAALGFVFAGFVPADAAEETKKPSIDVSKVRVPEMYGTIKQVHKGNDKVIFYLQDAHCNFEAQQNNARILQDLIAQYGIDTVCEEGYAGPMNLDKLISFPDKDAMRQSVTYFMKKGRFNGPEYLAVTGDTRFSIVGVEDKALYDQNRAVFLEMLPNQADCTAQIALIKDALNQVAQKTFSADLKSFVDKGAEYRAGKIKFTEWAQAMRDEAAKNGVDISAHKNFALQGKSFDMEGKIDFDAVEDERAAVVEEVSKKLAKEDSSNLVVQSLSFRLGRMGAVEYYDILKSHCDKAGVDLKTKANLVQYVDYIKAFDQIDKDALVDEAMSVEGAIKDKLFASDDQRKLDKMQSYVDMVGRMFEVKLGIRDYKVLCKIAADCSLASVVSFLKEQAPKHQVVVPDVNMAKLEPNMALIEKFFSTAVQREDALVKNTIATLGDKKLDRMVLVTGGFHTASVTDRLKKEGFSIVVITPRITDFEVTSPYFDAMKNDPIPINDTAVAEAMAGQTAAPPGPGKDTPGQDGAVDLATEIKKERDAAKAIGAAAEPRMEADVDTAIATAYSRRGADDTLRADVVKLFTDNNLGPIDRGVEFVYVEDTDGAAGVFSSINPHFFNLGPVVGYAQIHTTAAGKRVIGIPRARKTSLDNIKMLGALVKDVRKAEAQLRGRPNDDKVGLKAEIQFSTDRVLGDLSNPDLYSTQTLLDMASSERTDAEIAAMNNVSDPHYISDPLLRDFFVQFAKEVQAHIIGVVLPQRAADLAVARTAVAAKPTAAVVADKVMATIASVEQIHTERALLVQRPGEHRVGVNYAEGKIVTNEKDQAGQPATVDLAHGPEVWDVVKNGLTGGYSYISGVEPTAEQIAQHTREVARTAALGVMTQPFDALAKKIAQKKDVENGFNIQTLMNYEVENGQATKAYPMTANAQRRLLEALESGDPLILYSEDLSAVDALKNLVTHGLGLNVDELQKKYPNLILVQADGTTAKPASIRAVVAAIDAEYARKRIARPVKRMWGARVGDGADALRSADHRVVMADENTPFDVLLAALQSNAVTVEDIKMAARIAGMSEDAVALLGGVATNDEGGLIPPWPKAETNISASKLDPRDITKVSA